MTSASRQRAARGLGTAGLLLGAAGLFVWASGGFVAGAVSVRSPLPLLLAAALGLALAGLAGGTRTLLDAVGGCWREDARWPAVAAALLAVAVFIAGIRTGAFVAGGADSSGYVSQSRLWLEGRLTQRHELAARLRPALGHWAYAPLGYRPGTEYGTIVPTYAPGYPLTLAAARAIGGERAGYLVVPLLGACLIWLAFALGRRLADGRVGIGAALLVATSPTFLYQLVQPMSDIPASVWWALAAAGCVTGSPAALLGGGLAASMAVLTRPNLVPLAAVLGLYVLTAGGRGGAAPPGRLRRAAVFSAGVVPGCLAVALLHDHLYGSPFLSGYGSADYLYDRANVPANLHNYARWLWDTHARVIWLAPLALVPWVVHRVVARAQPRLGLLYAAMALVTLAVYLPYAVFENASYLRFLLPGLPFVLVLAVAAVVGLAARLPLPAGAAASILALTLAGGVQLREALNERVFDLRAIERRYITIAGQVASEDGPAPLVLAVQHSGSLAYYTHAPVLRWDLLDAAGLDAVLALAHADGRRVLLVLDQHEEAAFRTRFAGHPTVGRLDWPPRVRTVPPGDARIYDVADRARYVSGALVPLTWAVDADSR